MKNRTTSAITALFVVISTMVTAAQNVKGGDTPYIIVAANLPGSFTSAGAVDADGQYLFAATYEGVTYVLQPNNLKVVQAITHNAPVSVVKSDGKGLLYIETVDGDVHVHSLKRPLFREVATRRFGHEVRNLCLVPDTKSPVIFFGTSHTYATTKSIALVGFR